MQAGYDCKLDIWAVGCLVCTYLISFAFRGRHLTGCTGILLADRKTCVLDSRVGQGVYYG